MAMGLVNVGFDTKSFRDRYKLFQSRCKTFHVLGLKNKEHARNVFRVHAKTYIYLKWLKLVRVVQFHWKDRTGVCMETTGFRIRREGPQNVKGCWKLFLTHWTWIIVILINDNCVPKLFDRLALSPSSSGIRPVTSPPTKSPHRNTYRKDKV